MQEINSSLEDTAQQVITNLPHALKEIEALQDEAESLKENMASIKKELVNVDAQSSESVESLKEIHVVKDRMEQAIQSRGQESPFPTFQK